MNYEELKRYCLDKPQSSPSYPFNETTLVFKVCDKMFALIGEGEPLWINLKCDPNWARELRSIYKSIAPGYHMNKKHWNTVTINEDCPDEVVYELIDHSFDLVASTLPKRKQLLLK